MVADNKRRLPPSSLFGLGKGGWCQPWPVSWLLPVRLLLPWFICSPCPAFPSPETPSLFFLSLCLWLSFLFFFPFAKL